MREYHRKYPFNSMVKRDNITFAMITCVSLVHYICHYLKFGQLFKEPFSLGGKSESENCVNYFPRITKVDENVKRKRRKKRGQLVGKGDHHFNEPFLFALQVSLCFFISCCFAEGKENNS